IVALYENTELLEDLRSLRFVERAGTYSVDAVRNAQGHSDTAIAFCLALLASARNPFIACRPFIDRKLIFTPDEVEQILSESETGSKKDPVVAAAAAGFERERERARERARLRQQPVPDSIEAILREAGLDDPNSWRNPPSCL